MTDVAETELLIIGAGPSGLVAAITAARYGIEVVVAEQRAGGSSLSRALVVSTRGMELMRRMGWSRPSVPVPPTSRRRRW